MTQKTIRFVGASRVNQAVLPFFFNRAISLTPSVRRRLFKYADEATMVVRAYYRRSIFPHHYGRDPENWEVSPSALAAYAFFLRGLARGRIFRYGAIFHSVGIAAASLNHVEILQLLIHEGIPLDLLHEGDDTVLATAIRYHHEPLAHALMDAFPRFISHKYAPSAMYACIFSGTIPLFFDMVERGFSITFFMGFQDWIGTPLSAAVRRGRHTITRYLLKHAFTEANILMPKTFEYDPLHDYFKWTLFKEAICHQNREVLDHLKAHGWNPPAKIIESFCRETGILDSLPRLKFAETVYPDLPFREHIQAMCMDEDNCWFIDDDILRYYNLPLNEDEKDLTRVKAEPHDWRTDIPSTMEEIGECLGERPENILRLIPFIREQLRTYYQKAEFPHHVARASVYALCLAQHSAAPLFTHKELQDTVRQNSEFKYYAASYHERILGVKIFKKNYERVRKIDHIVALQGKDLQSFLDQSDEALEKYQTCYGIPIIRYIAEKSTVEALEMWMERGFPICACEGIESWHPTHYANPEILDYYFTHVGMHYRTRCNEYADTLAFSIRGDDAGCVKIFVKHGYPLNRRLCDHDYPLAYAFYEGAEKMTHTLYDAGAKMLDRKGRKMNLPPWFKPLRG